MSFESQASSYMIKLRNITNKTYAHSDILDELSS
jgi:hypothetical protein